MASGGLREWLVAGCRPLIDSSHCNNQTASFSAVVCPVSIFIRCGNPKKRDVANRKNDVVAKHRRGTTEVRTRVTGFRVQCDRPLHYSAMSGEDPFGIAPAKGVVRM